MEPQPFKRTVTSGWLGGWPRSSRRGQQGLQLGEPGRQVLDLCLLPPVVKLNSAASPIATLAFPRVRFWRGPVLARPTGRGFLTGA